MKVDWKRGVIAILCMISLIALSMCNTNKHNAGYGKMKNKTLKVKHKK
jgi:hypothetical protein